MFPIYLEKSRANRIVLSGAVWLSHGDRSSRETERKELSVQFYCQITGKEKKGTGGVVDGKGVTVKCNVQESNVVPSRSLTNWPSGCL